MHIPGSFYDCCRIIGNVWYLFTYSTPDMTVNTVANYLIVHFTFYYDPSLS